MLPGGVQQPQVSALRRGLCHFTTRQLCRTPTTSPGHRQSLETVAQSKKPDRRCQTLVSSNAIREQKGKEAILCQRFKAHNAAITALLVARDKGTTACVQRSCLFRVPLLSCLVCLVLYQAATSVAFQAFDNYISLQATRRRSSLLLWIRLLLSGAWR